jgi:hypothetical protein
MCYNYLYAALFQFFYHFRRNTFICYNAMNLIQVADSAKSSAFKLESDLPIEVAAAINKLIPASSKKSRYFKKAELR